MSRSSLRSAQLGAPDAVALIRGAASGGEEDDRRPRGGERGRRYGVVPRRFEQSQSWPRRHAAVTLNVDEWHPAAFLHRAQRLFLERRDAARDISRRRIFAHRLAVTDEIVLEIAHQCDCIVEHRSRRCAIHQNLLGAKDFRNFGQQHLAACSGDGIGHAPDEGVCGQPRQAVRPAAFDPEHEFGERAFAARRIGARRHQLVNERKARRLVILDRLCRERADMCAALHWDQVEQRAELVALAP